MLANRTKHLAQNMRGESSIDLVSLHRIVSQKIAIRERCCKIVFDADRREKILVCASSSVTLLCAQFELLETALITTSYLAGVNISIFDNF